MGLQKIPNGKFKLTENGLLYLGLGSTDYRESWSLSKIFILGDRYYPLTVLERLLGDV